MAESAPSRPVTRTEPTTLMGHPYGRRGATVSRPAIPIELQSETVHDVEPEPILKQLWRLWFKLLRVPYS